MFTKRVFFLGLFLLPTGAFAQNTAHDIWAFGVQIGMAEFGASTNADPAFVVQSLRLARQAAAASGCIATDRLDQLISQMSHATRSRDLYPAILAYRQGLPSQLMAHCSCGGGGSPAPGPLPTPATCNANAWVGTWNTSWNEMTLRLNPDGTFSGHYNTAKHHISGRLSPANPCVFVGQWRHSNSSRTGRIRFEMVAPGKFEGGYSYGDKEVTSTNWKGTKVR